MILTLDNKKVIPRPAETRLTESISGFLCKKHLDFQLGDSDGFILAFHDTEGSITFQLLDKDGTILRQTAMIGSDPDLPTQSILAYFHKQPDWDKDIVWDEVETFPEDEIWEREWDLKDYLYLFLFMSPVILVGLAYYFDIDMRDRSMGRFKALAILVVVIVLGYAVFTLYWFFKRKKMSRQILRRRK